MNKSLVIIPTYNEKVSLPGIIDKILKHDGFDVLVVDDASPDGTAFIVKKIIEKSNRVHLIERKGKYGLGTAYIAGFKWGLERGYEYLIEMDADGSHNPAALPWFIVELGNTYDMMIGSRYMEGKISVVGWDFRRLLLSKFGNFYASRLLGLRLTDLTSGFRCYRNPVLQTIELDGIYSNGYAFQIEMAFLVSEAGFKISEMPITFYERSSGSSKMSKKIIREAVFLPWTLRIRGLVKYFRRTLFQKKPYAKRTSH